MPVYYYLNAADSRATQESVLAFTHDDRYKAMPGYKVMVRGDGDSTHSQIISATDLAPFGTKKFSIPFDATGKKWVRFAVWDSAGNGAFTQPVHLGKIAGGSQ